MTFRLKTKTGQVEAANEMSEQLPPPGRASGRPGDRVARAGRDRPADGAGRAAVLWQARRFSGNMPDLGGHGYSEEDVPAAAAGMTGDAAMNGRRRLLTALVAAAAAALPAGGARAQDLNLPLADNHAEAKLFARAADGKLRAVIQITIEPGWHLYHDTLGHPKAIGLPTEVTMGPAGAEWTEVRFPKPHKLDQSDVDPDNKPWIHSHQGTILLYAEGTLPAGAAAGDVTARLRGQTCSATSCVDYEQDVVSGGPGEDALFADFPGDLTPAPAAGKQGDQTDYAAMAFEAPPASESLWYWLGVAFLAGILMNITPCVLPVISIKVLSFVQQAGESRGRMLLLGSAFAVGMLLVYWALAAAAIVLKLGWGEQFQSETFTMVMIALVFAFALSLMGVFTLGVPKKVAQLDAGISREGPVDALFKGMLATLLATPCAGPFMGAMLAWTLSQTNLTVFLVFTLLGLGMGLPYMILTTFPKLLGFLPRPGPWMETFKKVMGFVLMAMVIFLMIPLRQDLLFANTFLVFVAIGCWAWGHYVRFDQTAAKRLTILAVSVGIVALGAWFSFGPLRGAYARPADQARQLAAEDAATEGHVKDGRIIWEPFDKDRFNAYLRSGRTVFLDFTADWCKNCEYNERFVFHSGEVLEVLQAKNAVPMKADLSRRGPRTDMLKALRKRLGGAALPFLVIFPGDRPKDPIRLPDTLSVSAVVEALKTCPDPFASPEPTFEGVTP